MRYRIILLSILILAACAHARAVNKQSHPATQPPTAGTTGQKAAIDTVVQFLLTSAASDFHMHPPADRIRFRNVRAGHLRTQNGTKEYLLYGQFLPVRQVGKAGWIPFVTIKTSGYEQYIGGQASYFCNKSTVVWEKMKDLSSTLQSRFDSLK